MKLALAEAPAVVLVLVALCGTGLAACGASVAPASGSGGSGGAASGGGPSSTTSPSSSSSGGAGGQGGADFPTPADIGYHAVAPLPAGEIIVFNDWNAIPNTVNAVPAAGGHATTIFEAYRVWSMAVAPHGRSIAFACGFPADVQKAHYGTDVGDAIQHTWLYAPASQDITLLSNGNLNDECHLFSADEKNLYLCRRYDFTSDGTSKGYRVGVIHLADDAFTYLTPDIHDELDFHPAVDEHETKLLFGADVIVDGSQHRKIEVESLPPHAATLVRDDADEPVFSPDFLRLVYTDYADHGALYVANADGSSPVKVATEGGSGAAFSPDGSHVAFLVFDDAASCAHIDVVKTDGSEADAATRFRDCSASGEFITNIAWLAP